MTLRALQNILGSQASLIDIMNTAYHPAEIFRSTEDCSTAMTHSQYSCAIMRISIQLERVKRIASNSFVCAINVNMFIFKNRIRRFNRSAPNRTQYSHESSSNRWESQEYKSPVWRQVNRGKRIINETFQVFAYSDKRISGRLILMSDS